MVLNYTSSGVNFAVSPFRWSVALRKGHQLQHVEGIFPASNILLNVLNPTAFSGDQMKTVRGDDGGEAKQKCECSCWNVSVVTD